MLWNVLLKAFAFCVNWSTKNPIHPIQIFKNVSFKSYQSKVFNVAKFIVFFTSVWTFFFFPSWTTAVLHPFCLLLCQVSQPEDTFFLGMSSLCSFCAQWGGCILLSKSGSNSPVYKTPKLEICWDPPAAQRDTAYPKTKTLSLFWKWCIFSAWIKLGF